MKKVHSETLKKVRLFSDINYGSAERERKNTHAAMEKMAREESVEYKIGLAQRQCIQPLHKLEKDWITAKTAKVKDDAKIEQARINVCIGLDKAAANSIARIMAEIKQKDLANQGLCKNEFQQVILSVEDFYADFKNFCEKFDYFVTEAEFNKIISPFTQQNLHRVQKLGSLVGYDTPAIQLAENIELLKVYAIKEKELTV